MQLGISLSSTSRLGSHEAAAHAVARARAASGAGLDSMTIGDRHAMGPARYIQNTPMLGRLLAEWTGRPAGCLFLLPLWPPVLVAEQVGTLASIHDGPFIVQTGIGGSPSDFAAMGQTADHRVSVFEEQVRIVRDLLAGGTVSSERFGFEDVSLGMIPDIAPEWWMGTGNPAGLRRAARFGAAWYAGPGVTATSFRESDALYRQACADEGTAARVMLRRDVVVLRDGDRARALADEAVAKGFRGLTTEQLVVGSPADAIEQLAPWAEAGVDQIVARTMGIAPEVDLETIELLAEVRAGITGPAGG